MVRVWKVTWASTEDGYTRVDIYKNGSLESVMEISTSRVRTIAATVSNELRLLGIEAGDEVFIPAELYVTGLTKRRS